MSQPPLAPNWFIDIRSPAPSQISLDLARHLPRRAAAGSVVVIAERPSVLLSVVKKRWTIIIREVRRQYSSTLQPAKKEGLRLEIDRLESCTFAIAGKRAANTRIVFATFEDLRPEDRFRTIYLAMPLDYTRVLQLLEHVSPQGFLVTYVGWPETPDRLRNDRRAG